MASAATVAERAIERDRAGVAAQGELHRRVRWRLDLPTREPFERGDLEVLSPVAVLARHVELKAVDVLDRPGRGGPHAADRLRMRGGGESERERDGERAFHHFFSLYCAMSRMKSALTPLAASRTRSWTVRFA